MLFAIVPAPPPTRKNQRTTSCPAPISANVPYQRGSRLIFSAFECVSIVSAFTSQQTQPVFRALNFQIMHQSPQSNARCDPDEKLSLRIIKGKVRFGESPKPSRRGDRSPGVCGRHGRRYTVISLNFSVAVRG